MDLKEELKTLRLDERELNELTIREVIVSYRKLAKEVHPDRNGPENIAEKTAAFQKLNNAYESVLKYLISRENSRENEDTNFNDSKAEEHDDVKFTKDNFHNFNFPKEKDKSCCLRGKC